MPRLLLALVLAVVACSPPPPPPIAFGDAPLRLVDVGQGRRNLAFTIVVDTRPALDPDVAEQVFRFAAAPRAGVLQLGLGLEPGRPSATWRAEVVLTRPDGTTRTLLDETLDRTTERWQDRRLDLPAGELAGSTLTLRATARGEHADGVQRVVWGDPMLLPRPAAAKPSVILVSLDTLRSDHVGPRSGDRPTLTPNLDALAATSTLFTQAYSPSTWTLPSHVSLLWGRHPTIVDRVRADRKRPVPEVLGAVAPLAETFRDAGWLTAAYTGGGWMSPSVGLAPEHGFRRGFDRFVAHPIPSAHPGECVPARFDGPAVFEWASAWIREHAEDPFFLLVHTYEPHDRCPFLTPGTVDFDALVARPDRVRELQAYYEELVRRTDALMGTLRRTLAENGLDTRTVLAVTADHGEGFFEHGTGGHGCEVPPWEEVARVPLLVHRPGGTPTRVEEPVALVQVAPTLRALAGLDGPPADGPPLPGLGIPGAAAPELVYTGCGDQLAIRGGTHKLITSRDAKVPDRLFDMTSDPDERRNVAASEPEILRRLRAGAADYWAAAGPPPADGTVPGVDPKLREQLRALGYTQ